ncbi:MAG: hypothetical protein IJ348_02305 [Alistipes sp.]|nr:hypothetical protein [Alistipes sp.]
MQKVFHKCSYTAPVVDVWESEVERGFELSVPNTGDHESGDSFYEGED